MNSVCKPCDTRKKYEYERTTAGRISRKGRDNRRRNLLSELTKATVQLVIERNIAAHDQAQCCYCGVRLNIFGEWHLEHLIPLSKGGTNEVGNLDLSCGKCNLSKGAKTWAQFLAKLAQVNELNPSNLVDSYLQEKYELIDDAHFLG